MHPAAPCILIGAALEEFLRNWVTDLGLISDESGPSLDNYSNILRREEFIDKPDSKDIVSWAGLRNDAAHGHWEKVNDKKKISIMLDGVNLFLRKYSR